MVQCLTVLKVVLHLAKMVPSIDVFLRLSVIGDRKALRKEGHFLEVHVHPKNAVLVGGPSRFFLKVFIFLVPIAMILSVLELSIY